MSTFDELHREYLAHGWRDIERHGELTVGTRIYHRGQQYPGAEQGTGTVRAVLLRDPSPWSVTHGRPDVELIVEYDRDKPGLSAGRWVGLANYHVRVAIPQVARCIGTRVNGEGRHVRCWEDARAGGKLCAVCEPTRCPQHPGFEPDNCPGCGTAAQLVTG